jgi:GTPase SAR1 family protein
MESNSTGIRLESAEARCWFAEELTSMASILTSAEEVGTCEGGSGDLALTTSVKSLNDEIDKLNDAKYRFLIIGDFNRGKSSILNVLLGRTELLPIGATATTAIPTFVRYGDTPKVLVHFKNKSVKELSLDGYRNEYTLRSTHVKNKIQNDKARNLFKSIGNSIGEWLSPLDYAEFHCPIDLLSKGVEFIDTAGLNHTSEEDEKTLSYIKQCHGIIFVLSAEQQLTQKEKEYLETKLKGKVHTVFFLINKWEMIEDEDKKEIHEVFTQGLSESLGIDEQTIGGMWNKRIFDVYAKDALNKLKNSDSLNGTGFLEFINSLNYFLTNERLISELYPAVYTAQGVADSIDKKVSDLLLVLDDDLKTLEEKISKVNPHIRIMKMLVNSLEEKVETKSKDCSTAVVRSYNEYFLRCLNNFDLEFGMPEVSSLSKGGRDEYVEKLREGFSEYQREKIGEWNKLSQADVIRATGELTGLFFSEIEKYEKEREEIRDILEANSERIQSQAGLSIYEEKARGKVDISAINASATGKVVAGLAGGTAGTVAAGIGAVSVANTFLHTAITVGLLNPVTGGLMALTPVGWGLLGVGAITGIATAVWGRKTEVNKFRTAMQEQLKENLKATIDDENKMRELRKNIQGLFSSFEKVNKKMKDDVESLEKSLNNLLESKKQSQTNYGTERQRLENLSQDVLAQWERINSEYGKMATTIPNPNLDTDILSK